MATLRLESPTDTLDLDEQHGSSDGFGYQSHAGALGLGLPDADVQWFEGAGGGAVYRGRRVSRREIDLPVSIKVGTKADLIARLDRLTMALSQPCRLVRVDDDGYRWVLEVVHAGGGDYSTGIDTDGETEMHLTLQLHSGWTAWRRDEPESYTLTPEPQGLEVPYGDIQVVNPGSAEAYPTYRVQGPGVNFKVTAPDGRGFTFAGILLNEDSVLEIDTARGTVEVDGNNAYNLLAPGPHFPTIPPGVSTLKIEMTGTATGAGGSVLVKVGTTPRRINRFPNPSLNKTSGTAVVRTNQCLRPEGFTTTSWEYRTTGAAELIALDSSVSVPIFEGGAGNKWVRCQVTKTPSTGRDVLFFAPRAVHTGMATVSMYIKAKATVGEVRPVIRCTTTDDSGDLSEEDRVFPPVKIPTDGSPVRIWLENVEDLTGTNVRFGVRWEAVVGDWVDCARVLIEPVPELRDYFDGSYNPRAYPGLTASWAGTAGQSTSVLSGAAAVGWSGNDVTKCWVTGGKLHALAPRLGGQITGPPVSHTLGTPWVGSIAATQVWGSGQVAFSIAPSTPANAWPVARSGYVGTSPTTIRVSAAGGGVPAPNGTTAVVPRIYMSGSGIYRFDSLLMEASSTLGAYFTGGSARHINRGWYEWAGTANDSVSHEFPIAWERASAATVSYQPRRWAVL